MKHLDLSYILSNVSDDKEFVGQLLNVFISSLDQDIPDLEQAIASEDHEHIRRAAHKVKSGFRSLGMTSMTQYLQELEDMGRTNTAIPEIKEKLAGFLAMLPEVKSEVSAYRTSEGI